MLRSFEEEYVSFLKKHGIGFEERYLWNCSRSGVRASLRDAAPCGPEPGDKSPGYSHMSLRDGPFGPQAKR
jgi:hypothetical protein